MTNFDVHNPPMMECGHAANASDGNGNPSCVICVGIVPGAQITVETPNLEGRMARCTYRHDRAGREHMVFRPSSNTLAFFNHRPDQEQDEFYCGDCWGWD